MYNRIMLNIKGDKMLELISNNIDETIQIAYKLGKFLKQTDLIILTGELGSGKTYFTKGIIQFFTSVDDVCSPTFTIVNEYSTSPILYHFDVYRLNNNDEFLNIGGEEYLQNGICIIEWGEKILDVLPNSYLQIIIDKIDENTRNIRFIPQGEKYIEYIKEAYIN